MPDYDIVGELNMFCLLKVWSFPFSGSWPQTETVDCVCCVVCMCVNQRSLEDLFTKQQQLEDRQNLRAPPSYFPYFHYMTSPSNKPHFKLHHWKGKHAF